jgi:hypothetical protein
MRSKVAFTAIVALGLAQLGLMAFAAVPDVGPQYRAYYIDRTTGCLPREVPGTYELDSTLLPVSKAPPQPFDDILVCGFEASEPGGTWMRGREAWFRFAIEGPRTDLQLKLRAIPLVDPRNPHQRLTVAANGQDIGEVLFDGPELRDLAFAIPASIPLTTRGTLEIQLSMEFPTPLTPQESRRYAMLLTSLQLARDKQN